MTDRELLEFAAKAICGVYYWEVDVLEQDGNLKRDWYPLEDDGDALRLAVTLGMNLMLLPGNLGKGFCTVGVGFDDDSGIPRLNITEDYSQGTLKAVRRAIVRAAAEIGSRMP